MPRWSPRFPWLLVGLTSVNVITLPLFVGLFAWSVYFGVGDIHGQRQNSPAVFLNFAPSLLQPTLVA